MKRQLRKIKSNTQINTKTYKTQINEKCNKERREKNQEEEEEER